MCGNDSVAADTNGCECCPLQFGLLRNTSGSGKIVSTHPSALLCSFAYAHHADGFPFFQASPPISPVSGAVPGRKTQHNNDGGLYAPASIFRPQDYLATCCQLY